MCADVTQRELSVMSGKESTVCGCKSSSDWAAHMAHSHRNLLIRTEASASLLFHSLLFSPAPGITSCRHRAAFKVTRVTPSVRTGHNSHLCLSTCPQKQQRAIRITTKHGTKSIPPPPFFFFYIAIEVGSLTTINSLCKR